MPASRVPLSLRRKVSPGLWLFTGANGSFVHAFGVGIVVFGLYGTIVLHRYERPHHSWILYLLGPWVFPELVAACFALSPFRPYRGLVFLQRTGPVDQDDPVAMRLVELLKSAEARRQLWRHALKVSAILSGLMLVAAALLYFLGGSLTWSLAPADLGSIALGLMGSFMAVSSSYIGWALTTWVERETTGNRE